MPVYEYEGEGVKVLLRRPVRERDHPVVLKRRTVPSRLTVGVGAAPETQSQKTWKGYRDLELRGQLQDRPGYLPAETVKRALLEPEAD